MDKKKILIIDDEENFCKLVKKNLEQAGEFEVCIAINGEDGIRLIKELKPDLVLLDLIMPELDGADVVALIRDDAETKDTPIVFLTAIAKGGESCSQPSFTRGYSLLSKTVTLRELINYIRANVRK
jgi:two-component system alkaline phosphatase synthesis response regulator PhoP